MPRLNYSSPLQQQQHSSSAPSSPSSSSYYSLSDQEQEVIASTKTTTTATAKPETKFAATAAKAEPQSQLFAASPKNPATTKTNPFVAAAAVSVSQIDSAYSGAKDSQRQLQQPQDRETSFLLGQPDFLSNTLAVTDPFAAFSGSNKDDQKIERARTPNTSAGQEPVEGQQKQPAITEQESCQGAFSTIVHEEKEGEEEPHMDPPETSRMRKPPPPEQENHDEEIREKIREKVVEENTENEQRQPSKDCSDKNNDNKEVCDDNETQDGEQQPEKPKKGMDPPGAGRQMLLEVGEEEQEEASSWRRRPEAGKSHSSEHQRPQEALKHHPTISSGQDIDDDGAAQHQFDREQCSKQPISQQQPNPNMNQHDTEQVAGTEQQGVSPPRQQSQENRAEEKGGTGHDDDDDDDVEVIEVRKPKQDPRQQQRPYPHHHPDRHGGSMGRSSQQAHPGALVHPVSFVPNQRPPHQIGGSGGDGGYDYDYYIQTTERLHLPHGFAPPHEPCQAPPEYGQHQPPPQRSHHYNHHAHYENRMTPSPPTAGHHDHRQHHYYHHFYHHRSGSGRTSSWRASHPSQSPPGFDPRPRSSGVSSVHNENPRHHHRPSRPTKYPVSHQHQRMSKTVCPTSASQPSARSAPSPPSGRGGDGCSTNTEYNHPDDGGPRVKHQEEPETTADDPRGALHRSVERHEEDREGRGTSNHVNDNNQDNDAEDDPSVHRNKNENNGEQAPEQQAPLPTNNNDNEHPEVPTHVQERSTSTTTRRGATASSVLNNFQAARLMSSRAVNADGQSSSHPPGVLPPNKRPRTTAATSDTLGSSSSIQSTSDPSRHGDGATLSASVARSNPQQYPGQDYAVSRHGAFAAERVSKKRTVAVLDSHASSDPNHSKAMIVSVNRKESSNPISASDDQSNEIVPELTRRSDDRTAAMARVETRDQYSAGTIAATAAKKDSSSLNEAETKRREASRVDRTITGNENKSNPPTSARHDTRPASFELKRASPTNSQLDGGNFASHDHTNAAAFLPAQPTKKRPPGDVTPSKDTKFPGSTGKTMDDKGFETVRRRSSRAAAETAKVALQFLHGSQNDGLMQSQQQLMPQHPPPPKTRLLKNPHPKNASATVPAEGASFSKAGAGKVKKKQRPPNAHAVTKQPPTARGTGTNYNRDNVLRTDKRDELGALAAKLDENGRGNLSDIVMYSTELVVEAIVFFPWSWPASLSNNIAGGDSEDDNTDIGDSVGLVAASLVQFARDVIVPAMQVHQQNNDETETTTKVYPVPVVLGTVLLLRELLVQNSSTIFGYENLLKMVNEEFSQKTPKDERVTTGSEKQSLQGKEEKGEDEEEIAAMFFLASTLATSVIFCALERFNNSGLVSTFVSMMDSYDDGEEEFSSLLGPLDSDKPAILPDGQLMDERERAMWQSSYNLHAENHPTRNKGAKLRVIPSNVVHITTFQVPGMGEN